MTCLSCGCDLWHEIKHNLRVTTSDDCSCQCHCDEPLEGDFMMPELLQSSLDAKKIKSSKYFSRNKLLGRFAELYSLVDFKENGYKIYFTNSNGFDFIAVNDEAAIVYVVEVKYNRSRLSKLQRRVKCHCKRAKINHFTYRVTKDQLDYWLARYWF